jgi:phosphoribosyl-ATP pyrophosphohydrolase/phosphoribosyl-AMP cyclohydrolase
MPTADQVTWNERGLAPAVVQDARTGELLMLAWMNAESLTLTEETGFAHFYSRSRRALWKKGETSGNTLSVAEVRLDCDRDAILVLATPAGPACHTGTRACFFRPVDGEEDQGAGGGILGRLQRTLEERRDSDSATAAKSYTKSLLDKGMPKILAKIEEEHGELADELPEGEDKAVVHETADLLFHVMVGLVARGLSIDDVLVELGRRFGVSGHEEKASR